MSRKRIFLTLVDGSDSIKHHQFHQFKNKYFRDRGINEKVSNNQNNC
nr:MAG TPA: hypothetical protein [Caudoviricetes sp.]